MNCKYIFTLFFLNIMVIMTGCADTRPPSAHHQIAAVDPADSLIFDKKVYDVRYLNIAGFEHVKVDRYLLERVDFFDKLQGIAAKKTFIESFLNDAYLLNNKIVFTEANRISNEDLLAYFKTVSQVQGGTWDGEDADLLNTNASEENIRNRFIKSYRLHAEKEFKKELDIFSNLQTESEVEDYWNFLIENIEES